MTDQQQHQLIDLTGQDLALLLKQTILTFCQMNVTYRSKLEVVGSIHIKADEVEISSFLLQENCLNSSAPVVPPKSEEDPETLEGSLKEDSLKDGEERAAKKLKVEDTFCIVDANGDEQDGKSDKDSKSESENDESQKDGDDGEKMDTETSKDTTEQRDENEENAENDATEKVKSESVDEKTDENETGDKDEEDSNPEKKEDSLSSSPAPTTQTSIAKQLTGASLAAGSSSVSMGPRPVNLMMNGTHAMMRGGMPMMRHSNVVTSTASMQNSAMGPRIPMSHAAMVAMGAAQMAAIHPHHMFYQPSHHGQFSNAAHLSARAAIESIYRQNPPLTNRTINLAASGAMMRHPSMAGARGAMMRHPQVAGIHMLPARPTGGLVCPLCMATFSSQDQYLRHLTTHQRSSVY